jgi:trk system potassium uptake protein TrkA
MECAQDLYNILRIPGAHEVVELLGGRVLCVGFQLPTFTPLIMGPLKDYPDPALLATIRFVAYTSAGKLGIPHGETQFTIGDIVYLVGEPDKIQHFLKTALPSETSYTRVVIAGGGELGLQLATRLFGGDLDITLVEENTARAEVCSDLLPHALVMNGSSLNNELMMELGINDHTAFVAVTGDDENNIMSCLVAEKMGAHFTVARVDNRNYRPIIDSLALVDRVVSPQSSLINAIYHFVRGATVKGDRLLQKIPGEVVEFHVGAGHPWAGKDVIEIPIPRGCIISTVLRGDELLIATGKTRITVGDRVLVYGLPKSIKKLDSLLG